MHLDACADGLWDTVATAHKEGTVDECMPNVSICGLCTQLGGMVGAVTCNSMYTYGMGSIFLAGLYLYFVTRGAQLSLCVHMHHTPRTK